VWDMAGFKRLGIITLCLGSGQMRLSGLLKALIERTIQIISLQTCSSLAADGSPKKQGPAGRALAA